MESHTYVGRAIRVIFHMLLNKGFLLLIHMHVIQEEGWVVCRVFRKRLPTVQTMAGGTPYWFNDRSGFMAPELGLHHQQNAMVYQRHPSYPCKAELEYHHLLPQDHLLQLPQLQSPKLPDLIGSVTTLQPCSPTQEQVAFRYTDQLLQAEQVYLTTTGDASGADWRTLDKFMASQLSSHEDGNPKETGSYSNPAQVFQQTEEKKEALDYVVST
jgi:hypothetical protein